MHFRLRTEKSSKLATVFGEKADFQSRFPGGRPVYRLKVPHCDRNFIALQQMFHLQPRRVFFHVRNSSAWGGSKSYHWTRVTANIASYCPKFQESSFTFLTDCTPLPYPNSAGKFILRLPNTGPPSLWIGKSPTSCSRESYFESNMGIWTWTRARRKPN